MRRNSLLGLLFVLLLVVSASAQDSLELYLKAVKRSDPASQLADLERFLAADASSRLHADALALSAWDYLRVGDRPHAMDRARQLWLADPRDPLAMSILLDVDAFPETDPSRRLRQIQAAIAAPLRKPEGMRDIDFAILKQDVWRSLTAGAGLTYVDLKDYRTAATYLQQVVEAAPDDPRYVFGLGNALLHLKGREPEAFWYFARAVNLSSYSPQGQQLAAYARDQYHHAGGNDRDWDAFLTAAEAPRESMSPVVSARKSGPPVTGSALAAKAAKPNSGKHVTEKEALEALYRDPSTGAKLSPPLEPRPAMDAPVSLGILVQTARLTPAYRHAIVFALSDLVRHLRGGDEAFILAFSNHLDFVQDLTDNYLALQDAMDHIKPAKGAALFDAVAFASGHLKRIAKNKNRILLVISDGSTSQGNATSFDLSANLKEVRVDCIGVNVSDDAQRNLLRNLSYYSGGQTAFITDAPEFRATTKELAQQMGIDVPR